MYKNNYKKYIKCVLCIAIYASLPNVIAQTNFNAEEQRLRAREDALQRAQQQNQPDVRLQPDAPPFGSLPVLTANLPAEPGCFSVRHFKLAPPTPPTFQWVAEWLAATPSACLGPQGIETLIRRISSRLIAEGYVTTRIALPEQSIAEGTLLLELIPGRVGQIHFSQPSPARRWQSALPTRPGDILNIRNLEQGLEQFKRLPSQDADINIEPGEAAGSSDLLITLKETKPWRLSLTLDDGGSRSTGKNQGSLAFAFDNPLGLNDQFTASISEDLWNDRDTKGTGGQNFAYALPWGNWTLQYADNAWRYRQTIQGTHQTFEYAGHSQSRELRLQRVVHRDQTGKTSLQLRLVTRHQDARIDQVDLITQRRQTTALEYGLAHRHYLGNTQLDLSLARREGKPWLGGLADPSDHQGNQATWRYRLNTLDASIVAPLALGPLSVRWITTLRLQYTQDPLYAAEFIAIGNRYTVRGFDGERTLAAERGGYWKNDLELPLGQSGQRLYIGLDYGHVAGPSAQALAGHSLMGSALGMRGTWQGHQTTVSYDLSAGWALHKPESLITARPALAATLTIQF